MRNHTPQDGITLLVTLLVMSVLLAISGSLLHLTLKQFQLSGIALASEMAFHAANAGIECALHRDNSGVFDIDNSGITVSCMGDSDSTTGSFSSADEQQFQFDWGSPEPLCTEISIYKFFSSSGAIDMSSVGVTRSCPESTTCTVIQSRGYNNACSSLSNPRTVERELVLVY